MWIISWERHRVYSVVVHMQCTLNNACKCDNTGSHNTIALYTERTGMAECLRSWAQCPLLACSSAILLCHRSQRSIVGSLKARQTGAGGARQSLSRLEQVVLVSCKQIIPAFSPYNGLQWEPKVQMRVSVQLQRALNDTRR